LVGGAIGCCLVNSLALAQDAFDQRWIGAADWPASALAYAKPAPQTPDPLSAAIRPPSSGLPAESGINYTLSPWAGYLDLGSGTKAQATGGTSGSVAFPLGHSFGLFNHATAGSIGSNSLYDGGSILYWRDPNVGLIGAGGEVGHFSGFGGANLAAAGGNFEAFVGPFTPFATVGSLGIQHVATKGYGTLGSAYYPTPNIQLTLKGYDYGGFSGLNGGAEYLLPLSSNGVATTISVEGFVGNRGLSGATASLKFLFGPTAANYKTLIERRRQDDSTTLVDHDTSPLDAAAGSLAALATPSGKTVPHTGTCSDGQSVSSGCFCPAFPVAAVLGGQCSFLGPSDLRLKRDIIEVAQLDDGITLYRYRYVWSDQVYVGVLAQEVEKVFPDAVYHAADGYLRVIYSRLAFPLMTWEEWTALGGSSIAKSCQARPQIAGSDGHVGAAVTMALLSAEADKIVPRWAE
jgi:hypothetical protein